MSLVIDLIVQLNCHVIDLVTISDAILTGRQTRLEITVFVWKSDVK